MDPVIAWWVRRQRSAVLQVCSEHLCCGRVVNSYVQRMPSRKSARTAPHHHQQWRVRFSRVAAQTAWWWRRTNVFPLILGREISARGRQCGSMSLVVRGLFCTCRRYAIPSLPASIVLVRFMRVHLAAAQPPTVAIDYRETCAAAMTRVSFLDYTGEADRRIARDRRRSGSAFRCTSRGPPLWAHENMARQIQRWRQLSRAPQSHWRAEGFAVERPGHSLPRARSRGLVRWPASAKSF